MCAYVCVCVCVCVPGDVVKVKVEVCMVQWCAYEGKREGEGK